VKTQYGFLSSLIIGFFFCHEAKGDQYHFANSLVGTRAVGLGGAFTALADDSSGIYYNPGGTPFASSQNLSGSASTFYMKRTEYSAVVGDKSVVAFSKGTASSSLGGLARVGGSHSKEGLTFGLALWMPDTNLTTEDSDIQNELSPKVISYKTQGTQRSGTVHIAGSVATCIGQNFGVGVSLGFFDIDEHSQSSERVIQGPFSYTQQTESSYNRSSASQMISVIQLRGLSLGFGVRLNLAHFFSLGASGRALFVKKQTIRKENSRTETNLSTEGVVVSQNTSKPIGDPKIASKDSNEDLSDSKTNLPFQFRAGLAWIPATWFTVTADLAYSSRTDHVSDVLPRSEVKNYHVGLELVPFSLVALRVGGFTNYDADLSKDVLSVKSRGEFLDARGLSAALGLRYSGSEYGLAFTRQWGDGFAQKFAGRVSPVTSVSTVFSATVSQAF
jgi:hypothetical protein